MNDQYFNEELHPLPDRSKHAEAVETLDENGKHVHTWEPHPKGGERCSWCGTTKDFLSRLFKVT